MLCVGRCPQARSWKLAGCGGRAAKLTWAVQMHMWSVPPIWPAVVPVVLYMGLSPTSSCLGQSVALLPTHTPCQPDSTILASALASKHGFPVELLMQLHMSCLAPLPLLLWLLLLLLLSLLCCSGQQIMRRSHGDLYSRYPARQAEARAGWLPPQHVGLQFQLLAAYSARKMCALARAGPLLLEWGGA